MGCGDTDGVFVAVHPGELGPGEIAIVSMARMIAGRGSEMKRDLRAGAHGWTGVYVADRKTGVAILLLDDFEHTV